MQKTERNWHTFNTQNKKGQRLLLKKKKTESGRVRSGRVKQVPVEAGGAGR